MTDRRERQRTALSLTVATVCALAAAFSLSGCKKTAPDDAEKTAVSVQAAHPELTDITEEITGDATLAPVAQAAIQPKITAPIRTFYVQRGARVKAGQLLATLENRDLAAAAADANGALTAAEGAYTTATKQQVPQEETQARLDVDQARAASDLAESIAASRARLYAEGAIPGRDVDTAKATARQAKAAFEIAQQKFNAITSLGRQASLQSAEGQLASARSKYLGAEAQLGYTDIRTPISGVVTDRPLFAGETAAAGSPIITVMDTTVLLAKLHLSQSQAQQLALGSEAELAVPGVDDLVEAVVSLISPALDPGSTTVEVWLRVKNADGKLKAGTSVHATIKGRTIKKTLVIPADAVQRSSDTGNKIVMVVAPDGTAKKKTVTLGVQTPENAQVTAGLTAADIVITSGGYGLDDGSKVRIEAAKPEADKPDAGKPGAGDND